MGVYGSLGHAVVTYGSMTQKCVTCSYIGPVVVTRVCHCPWFKGFGNTLIKRKQIFLIYKTVQMGSGEKSYMRKGFLKYEEMRKYFITYEEAVSHI
jgi:hypothetical protein